ncbi:MAG: pilus assembly protein [Actinomycetota bacterium]|nr:pilus assembly protein [Actinomycetota bacterium]
MTESKGVCTVRHLRRSRDDDGAAAVEFALLFPIFMILALGLIAGGTAFSKQINVTQAAREASRYGATYDIKGITGGGNLAARTQTWMTAVDNALTQSVGNQANPIGGYDYRCVALVVTDSAGAATSSSKYMENGGSVTSGACPSTATAVIPSATYVQTVLLVNQQFFVLFINPKIHLDAVSVTPYEGKFE